MTANTGSLRKSRMPYVAGAVDIILGSLTGIFFLVWLEFLGAPVIQTEPAWVWLLTAAAALVSSIIAVSGGIHAVNKRRWGRALAASIAVAVSSLGAVTCIFWELALLSSAPAFPRTWLVVSAVVVGIGILPLILTLSSRHEFSEDDAAN